VPEHGLFKEQLGTEMSERIIRLCKIFGFHGGDYEESSLLGCGTV
jgi:hypothetical protein